MLYCHIHVHAEIYIYMLDTFRRNDKDRRRKTSLTIFLPLTLFVRFRKGCVGFYCERELEIEHNCNILTPLLWGSALCLSHSPRLLNRRPRAHSAGWWLSLLHLISIFSGPQLIRAPSPFGLVWLYLPHLVSLQLSATQLASVQFISLILPSNCHAEIWTPLHASAISSDIWRSGCVTSAIFGMACVIVIERR